MTHYQRGRGSSIANFAVSGLELIQLRLPLRGEFSLGSLTVEIGAGAVVKGGMKVHPYLNCRVSAVRRWVRRFRQAELNQHSIEEGQPRILSRLAMGRTRFSGASRRFYRMIRPQSPA